LPPGYYVLLRAWEFFSGRSEFALRYFSLIFGVLGVALIYRLGRRGLGTGAGVIAALLLTLQPFHTFYSQDARMYSLMPVERWRWFSFSTAVPRVQIALVVGVRVVSGLAVLTHYFMGFMVAAFVRLSAASRPLTSADTAAVVRWVGNCRCGDGRLVITSRASHLVERVLRDIRGTILSYG